jgi:hypothetical protein
LHVIERWRSINDAQGMEAIFTVEDPYSFYQPWTGRRCYWRAQQEPLERICAEYDTNLFDCHMPVAEKPDF